MLAYAWHGSRLVRQSCPPQYDLPIPTPMTTSSLADTNTRFTPERLGTRAHLERLLAETDSDLARGDISGMDRFAEGLDAVRRSLDSAEWRSVITHVIAPHAVRARIHEEPFTRRAFTKPRGYPGDAPMLDLIYGDSRTTDPLTDLGEQLHVWAADQPGCRSVRERRCILASTIDRIAAECARPRVLSLACGHLREAQVAQAVRAGQLAEFVAADQDIESLAVVEREQRKFGVTPVRLSVKRFLASPRALGHFDFVYAAGLYDYLPNDVAIMLTRAMFDVLRPGGSLLVANFAPELRDIGYMESIMDWNLIYRREDDVARFACEIPTPEIAEMSVYRDSCGNVVYLSLRRA